MRLRLPVTGGLFFPGLLRRRIGRGGGGGGANNTVVMMIPCYCSRAVSSSSISASSSSSRLLQLCNDVSLLKQLQARYIIHGLLHLFTSQLISSYARLRHLPVSLHLFRHYHRHRSPITSLDQPIIFLAIIQALSKSAHLTTHNDHHLVFGMTMHSLVVQLGYYLYMYKGLLFMYAKLGSISMAYSMFEDMPQSNIDSAAWSLIITAYSERGQHHTTLQLLARMGKTLIWPDLSTAIAAVRAELKALNRGKEIHAHLVMRLASLSFDSGQSLIPLHNTLIEMYANCGCLDQAKAVFYQLGNRKPGFMEFDDQSLCLT